jgi:hypothetical protein
VQAFCDFPDPRTLSPLGNNLLNDFERKLDHLAAHDEAQILFPEPPERPAVIHQKFQAQKPPDAE